MKRIKIVGLLFMAVVISLGSCSKEGPAGPQGPQGEQGRQGEQGQQGIPGADGSNIYSGNGAPTADIGQNGDFYIDLSASMLYGPKTDKGWGNGLSLKGEKGDKGDTGQKGDKGDPGRDGKDGSRILSGTSAPTAKVGKTGDYYWDISNYTLYGPKTSSGWGNGIVLRGPKGDKGTANVMYSDWVEFNWLFPFGFSYMNQMNVVVPELTNDFINNGGVVLVYFKEFSDIPGGRFTEIFQLPYTPYSSSSSHYSLFYRIDVLSHRLFLRIESTNDDILPSGLLTDNHPTGVFYRFRYILIPGGVHLRHSSPPPDIKDYKATCAYYGIPE